MVGDSKIYLYIRRGEVSGGGGCLHCQKPVIKNLKKKT